MNRRDTQSARCTILLLTVFAISSYGCKTQESEQSKKSRNHVADSLYNKALDHTIKRELDSAVASLVLVTGMYKDEFKPDSYDNAVNLLTDIASLRRRDKSIQEFLAEMSDEDYELLEHHQLTKVQYSTPSLDKILIDTLFAHRNERDKYVREKKKKQAMLAKQRERELAEQQKAEEIADAEKRRAFGDRFREGLLDEGLDIKVKVYGVNNTIIRLQYVLFSDVWSHKLSKNGTITHFRDMGFKKCIMTDGYDWTVYWDF